MKLHRVALACAVLLGACATTTSFVPDLTATAPKLSGYGRSGIAIGTSSREAQRLFNEGVLQAYAFNEKEAVRLFKAALAQDPACVMCAWGVAWQLGPNINDNGRGGTAEAQNYVGHALKHIDRATPRERTLVETLALRYAHASAARETAPLLAPACSAAADAPDLDKPTPLDIAYAAKLRALADAYPDDADIASLYAEAEMIATDADRLWDDAGRHAAGRIGEVAARIERLLAKHPDHTGLNHYMVHLADAVPVAQRAVAAADRLAQLAPASPHLVHMPAHIYVHVGRYGDAVAANVAALDADAALAREEQAQGFAVSKDWRGHNRHFLWYASIMAAREAGALAAADGIAERMGSAAGAFAEYARSLRIITLVRMEDWQRVLAESAPAGDQGVAQAWYESARGIAFAKLGRAGEAQEALDKVQAAAAAVRTNFPAKARPQKLARAQAEVAEAMLRAQLALAQRQYDEALAQQRQALQAAQLLDEHEPPALADGMRLALGDIQLAAGRAADAEASFRTALAEHPGSGWALRGLARALQAQHKSDEAAAVLQQLQRAWSEGDARLRAAA